MDDTGIQELAEERSLHWEWRVQSKEPEALASKVNLVSVMLNKRGDRFLSLRALSTEL